MLYKYLPASISELHMNVKKPILPSNFDSVSEYILVPSFIVFSLKAVTSVTDTNLGKKIA